MGYLGLYQPTYAIAHHTLVHRCLQSEKRPLPLAPQAVQEAFARCCAARCHAAAKEAARGQMTREQHRQGLVQEPGALALAVDGSAPLADRAPCALAPADSGAGQVGAHYRVSLRLQVLGLLSSHIRAHQDCEYVLLGH
eukprot:scaffold61328_cov26-Tisochrysis_lutea.AAC.3